MMLSLSPSLRRLLKSLLLLLPLGLAPAWSQTCPEAPPPLSGEQLLQLREHSPDRGALWRLERDGHRSYLYASMHLGRPEWVLPGPALRQAAADIDTLVLELDLSDPAVLQILSNPSDKAAPIKLPAALAARLEHAARQACLDPKSLERLHPLLQLSQLQMLQARYDGLDAQYGQELTLMLMARARQLRIRGLETPQDQLQALLPTDRDHVLREVREGLEQLEKGQQRPVMRRLADAWEHGDLDTLSHYEQWCDCANTPDDRAAIRRLNDERNPAMARRIGELHREGGRLLVAVGALHMTGSQALTTLLQRDGFSVEQLWPPAPKPLPSETH